MRLISYVKRVYPMIAVLQLFVMLGITLGYSAYILPQWHADPPSFFVAQQLEWLIGSTSVDFRAFGALLDILIVDRWGRRSIMLMIFLLLVISWTMIGSAFNIEIFLAGRILISFLVGMMASPYLYIYESTSNSHRVVFMALVSPLMSLGTALTYLLMDTFNWRVASFIFAGYSLATLCALCTIPESAYWYRMKGRTEEANRVSKWFEYDHDHDDDDKIKTDITDNGKLKMTEEITVGGRRQTTNWRILFGRQQPVVRNRFLALASIACLSEFTGLHLMQNYAMQFFDSLRSELDVNTLTVTFGFLCFFCDLLFIALVNKFRRKSLLIFSCSSMLLCVTIAVSLQILAGWPPLSGILKADFCRKLSVLAMFGYSAFARAGIYELVWIIIPEMFPAVLRSIVLPSVTLGFYLSMTIAFNFYPILMMFRYGFILVATIFTCCLIAIIAIILFFIPETRCNERN